MKKDWDEIAKSALKVVLAVGITVGNALLCSRGFSKVLPEDWCR